MYHFLLNSVVTAWQGFNIYVGLAIFCAYILIDALNAYYTLNVVKLKELAAANTTVFLYLLLAFGVINYTHNFLYIVPVAMGGWVGTFFLVRRERARAKKVFLIQKRKRMK